MYDIEKIYLAETVQDAIAQLEREPEAVIISGGSDVLIKIREGHLAGCLLVSIHGIKELQGIEKRKDGTIVIRPAATFTEIAGHPIIEDCIPVLGEAVSTVGSPQIRNIGTIGGNICNGVTSADSASTLFALNAILELTGALGKRTVPIEEFYTGAGKTVRGHAEILTGIFITSDNYEGYYGSYTKYGKRNAMEIATLGCSVMVKLTPDKEYLENIRIAFGVAAPVPMRCLRTEESVRGSRIEDSLYRRISESVILEVSPRSSWRASKEFRMQLVKELAARAAEEAVRRAREGGI